MGSLDAAFAFGTEGGPAIPAASGVLGYRPLTVWPPLVPGLVTLGVFVRREVLCGVPSAGWGGQVSAVR
ncbi:hypothetical protein [Streptomyces sp. NPDC001851]|uniref:hypothetical protein n=1 Tax=Streptomyces sp. NPDC001851 TaxID=3154529 RepID=UPI0033245CCB